MDTNNNYFPTKEKEIQIPNFLANRNEESNYLDGDLDENYVLEETDKINKVITEGRQENDYHLRGLDKQADAYTAEEARVIIKRLVSNYPDIVLEEVSSLIKDMQDLAGVILKNSSVFAKKRGEI